MMHAKYRVAGIGPLLLALCLPACASTDAAPAASAAQAPAVQPLTQLPTGTRWTLADSARDGLQSPEAARVVLRIEEGRLFGNTGCNQYSAGITLDPQGRVTLEPVVATKRGCIGPTGTVEKFYFEALRSLQSISRDGDSLTLRLAAGDALRFTLAPAETE